MKTRNGKPSNGQRIGHEKPARTAAGGKPGKLRATAAQAGAPKAAQPTRAPRLPAYVRHP